MAVVRVNFARFADNTVIAYYTYDDGNLNVLAAGVENNSARSAYAHAQRPNNGEIYPVVVEPFTHFEEDVTAVRPRLRMEMGTDDETGESWVGPPYTLEARWPA